LFSTDQFLNIQNDELCRSQPTWRGCSAICTPQVVDGFWGNHIGRCPKNLFLEKGVMVDSKTFLKGVLEKEVLFRAKSLSAIGHGVISRTQLQHTSPCWYRTGAERISQTSSRRTVGPQTVQSKSIGPFPVVHRKKACSTKHRSLDAPRATPVGAWEVSDEGYLRAAADASSRRSSPCIRAKGGHFEI
uniref:Phlebovirus_G2 domain-containing protein n=1 Tax=Haemonchus placei TaxID=6290 RepID=A0A0N4WGH3_HAEPC